MVFSDHKSKGISASNYPTLIVLIDLPL